MVQFRAPPAGGSPAYDGRVEHLVLSGQVARFYALEDRYDCRTSEGTRHDGPEHEAKDTWCYHGVTPYDVKRQAVQPPALPIGSCGTPLEENAYVFHRRVFAS